MEGDLPVRIYHAALQPVHRFYKVYRRSRDSPEEQERDRDSTDKPVPQQTLKLTDQYLALLVTILTNAGLCQVRCTINRKKLEGKNSPLTHSDCRRLPPCLKNQRQGLIYHVRLHYSWPKFLHWQIGYSHYHWLPKFKYERDLSTDITKPVADCSIPGDTRSFLHGH